MKSRDQYTAVFNTEAEIRTVMLDLTGYLASSEFIFITDDKTRSDKVREALKTILS